MPDDKRDFGPRTDSPRAGRCRWARLRSSPHEVLPGTARQQPRPTGHGAPPARVAFPSRVVEAGARHASPELPVPGRRGIFDGRAAATPAETRVNLASLGELPAGSGLAAAFKGDAAIRDHPEVIFADGFEWASWGAAGMWMGGQDKHPQPGGARRPRVGARCLRVEAHLGRDTGGASPSGSSRRTRCSSASTPGLTGPAITCTTS